MKPYRELLQRTDAPPGSAWGLWGEDDELGTINALTPERVLEGLACARRGAVFNLDLPLDAFEPPLSVTRNPARHVMFANNPVHRDEYLDGFYPQCSTQIDGLRHIGNPDHGFYNGADPERLVPGDPLIGINRWAEHGIVGRGVLVDVARYLESRGETIDQRSNQPVPIGVVDDAARAQGVEIRPGDILMLRFGWVQFYLDEATAEERAEMPKDMRSPGLLQAQETVEWIWDHQLALVAADNIALEAYPPDPSSPFTSDHEEGGGPKHSGIMHRVLIPLLGLAVGEFWWLDELAADCAQDGVYESLVVAKPLNLTGGAGSPANAVAIK